jgi:hypothetical protein
LDDVEALRLTKMAELRWEIEALEAQKSVK